MIWKAGPLVAQTSRIFIKQATGCVDRTNWLQLSYRSSGQQATKREGTLAQEAALCLFGFPFYTFCLLPVVRDWLYCMQIGDGYQCSPDWLHLGPVRGEGVFSQFRACTNRGWYQHLPDWLYPWPEVLIQVLDFPFYRLFLRLCDSTILDSLFFFYLPDKLWGKLSAEELMLLNCGVGLDSWESLGLKRRSNQPILKEVIPGCSLEGLMLKLKLQYFGHLMWSADSFEKTLMLGKTEGRRRG